MKSEINSLISELENTNSGHPWFGRAVYEILEEADRVIRAIMDRYFQKNVTYSEIDPKATAQFDLLRDFTRLCRKEMMKY